MHFLEWKLLHFDSVFTEVHKDQLWLDNGLALDRDNAITWTSVDAIY